MSLPFHRQLEISVTDHNRSVLEDAQVVLTRTIDNWACDHSDKERLKTIRPGVYSISVSATGFETQTRMVKLSHRDCLVYFVLGTPGLPFYFQGNVKTPFEQKTLEIALSLVDGSTQQDEQDLVDLFQQHGCASQILNSQISSIGLRVFQLAAGTDPADTQGVCDQLNGDARVAEAGPILLNNGQNVRFLTNKVNVRFKGGLSNAERDTLATSHNFTILNELPGSTKVYVLEWNALPGYGMVDDCNALLNETTIEYATPKCVENSIKLQITPGNFLFPYQWYLPLMQVPEAWQRLRNANNGVTPGQPGDKTYGSSDVRIAVLDNGVLISHPSFAVNLFDTLPKIRERASFKDGTMPETDYTVDKIGGTHGTGVAGACSAAQNGSGTIGVAPNTQLMPVVSAASNFELRLESFQYAGGLESSLPSPLQGADVLSFSISVPGTPDGELEKVFRQINAYGRAGRGGVLVFAAGNNGQNVTTNSPLAALTTTIAVAASSLDVNGNQEVFTSYSAHGDRIDVCAPSATSEPAELHNPPLEYAVATTTISDTDLGSPNNIPNPEPRYRNLPGEILNTSFLVNQANQGAEFIAIDPLKGGQSGFNVGDAVLIGSPGDLVTGSTTATSAEARYIASVTNNNELHFDDGFLPAKELLKTHATGPTVVHGGTNNYTEDFGGTSFSAPLVAGVVALMLTMKESLTWVEVRELLRNSARKINIGDQGKKWEDENEDNIIDGSGDLIPLDPAVSTNLAGQFTATPGNHGTDILDLTDPAGFEVGQAIYINDPISANREFSVIKSIDGSQITVDSLLFDHPIGSPVPVEAGRTPKFSRSFGYGRVDADVAVKAAGEYNHEERDLMIRNDLNDMGVVLTTSVQSPDIWLRNKNVDLDDIPDKTKDGPHESPKINKKRHVYARITNRATIGALKNLEANIRFYVALSDTTDPNFPFPTAWLENARVNMDMGPGDPITYFLEETIIAEDTLGPGDEVLVSAAWGKNDLPNVLNDFNGNIIEVPHKTYLLVQVAPGDGLLNESDAKENNNLSYREILFADTIVTDLDGSGALPGVINLEESETSRGTPFKVNVRTHIGSFDAQNVELKIIRTSESGTDTEAVFKWTGSVWEFTSPALGWANVSAPVVTGTSTPASGDQIQITFEGNFIVNQAITNVTLQVDIKSASVGNPLISTESYPIKVVQASPTTSAVTSGFVTRVKLETPFDVDLLPAQNPAKKYGSLSDTEYRVTSVFNGQNDTDPVKAYAIANGSAFIQEVSGSTSLVNLILKPEDQPETGYAPVKYFVYRGLKKSSFLQTNEEVLSEGSATTDLLTRMWQIRNNLNADQLENDPQFIAETLKRSDLGITEQGEPPLSDDMLIEAYFDTYNFQPFLAGAYLGEFDTSGDYGFQVMLEGPNYNHKLGDVRSLDHIIEITYEAGQNEFGNQLEEDISTKLKREQVLSYLDPAAYFGLLSLQELTLHKAGSTIPTEGEDTYTEIISKFATKDKVYVDIRNELNNSLNFHGNYGNGLDVNAAQVQFEDSSGSLVSKNYHEDGWPLLTLNASDFAAGAGGVQEAKFALPIGDNSLSTLFLSGASFLSDYPAYGEKFKILNSAGSFTDPFEVGIPYNDTLTTVFPFALKFSYVRRYDNDNLDAIPSPLPRPWKDDYIDNLLSRFDVLVTPDEDDLNNATTVQWNTSEQLKYIGWTSLKGIDFTVRSGFAKDSIGEVVFAFMRGPSDVYDATTNISSTSTRATHSNVDLEKGQKINNSFYSVLRDELNLVQLSARDITLSPNPPITSIQVDANVSHLSVDIISKSAENLFSLAYSASEKITIETFLVDLLADSPYYFVLFNHSLLSDDNDLVYYEAEIGVQYNKYDTGTFVQSIERVNTAIKVYSYDGRNYFTIGYSNVLAPLIPQLFV